MNKQPILYRLVPFDPSGHRYRVHLTIRQPDARGQKLALPAWIPGSYLIRDFSRQILTLQASCRGRPVPARKLDNHTWQCAPCDGPLHAEYTVYAWDLSVRGAHLDETHAFFNGASVFLCPLGHETAPCLLELQPPPHTRGWRVYTSLPSARGHARAARPHGFGMYSAPDYDALLDHPVEIGTPQVVRFQAHGAQHEMVFTGVAPRLDLRRIAADARRICEAQIAFFEPETRRAPFTDSSDRYVFLTTITDDGYGGLEHRASTALLTSRRSLPTLGRAAAGADYEDFLGLVSHEYFHTWHVKRIKPAAFAPYDLARENHTRLLWVFEGWTSYYDDLMLLRSGVISQQAYLQRVAKTISAVMRGPGRHKQSIADSSFDAWTRYYKQDENSPNALVSYYTKGALAALGLDLLIRSQTASTRSLDDVMRLLWAEYGRDFYRGQARGVPEQAIASLVRRATGVDVSDYIARYVTGCEDIPLDRLLAGQGMTLRTRSADDLPSLDARLRDAQGQTQLATVYEGGVAHAAGLSAGDVLLALDGLRINSQAGLERLLRAYQGGEIVRVHVFRRDELRAFDLKLAPPRSAEYVLESADAS